MNIEGVSKFLFRYPWDTFRGLVNYFFIALILFIAIFQGIARYIIAEKDFINYLYGCVLIILMLFISWLVNRINYFYWANKIKVIFAVTVDVENKDLIKEYHNLIANFNEKLKDYGLTKYVKVSKKPIDIKFSDHAAAEKKTKWNQPCSTLIISGIPIEGKGEVEFKLNFHYEYCYYRNSKEAAFKNKFNDSISKGLAGRTWLLRNNVRSKNSLCANLFDSTTYILALCSATISKYDLVKELLKPIIDECNENKHKKEYGSLILELRSIMYEINKIQFYLKAQGLSLEELKPHALEMQRLNEDNLDTLIVMALITELEGDRGKSWEYSLEAKNQYPDKIYVFQFNFLYYYLTENNYSEALLVLDELIGDKREKDVIFILNFLYHMYDKIPDLAIFFDIGAVSILWGEKELGRKELNNFIHLSEGNKKYELLIQRTRELLK